MSCHIAAVLFRRTDLRIQDHEAIDAAVQELRKLPCKKYLLPIYLQADDLAVDAAVHGNPEGLRARCQEGLFWRAVSQLSEAFESLPGSGTLVSAAFRVTLDKIGNERPSTDTPLDRLIEAYGRCLGNAMGLVLKAACDSVDSSARISLHFGKSFLPTAAKADAIAVAEIRKHISDKVERISAHNTSLIYDITQLPVSLDTEKYWKGHWGTLMQFLNCCQNHQGHIKAQCAKLPRLKLHEVLKLHPHTASMIAFLECFQGSTMESLPPIFSKLSYLFVPLNTVFRRQIIFDGKNGAPYREDLGFWNETMRQCRRGDIGEPQSEVADAADEVRDGPKWLARIYGKSFARRNGRFDVHEGSAFKDLTGAVDFTEAEARRLLGCYLDSTAGGIKIYEQHRSRIDLSNASSRLSPFLVFGLLSPKRFQAEIQRLEKFMERAKLKTFGRRLIWRDLAYWQLWTFPYSHTHGIRRHYDDTQWRSATDAPRSGNNAFAEGVVTYLARWQYGYTGYPLVDAGMRQLWAAGWMQQNVRMVVASFLVEFLNLDWKHGHRWFIETLLDHDIAINSMMWQNAGRSGFDQWNFVLSPTSGSTRDPQGKYCCTWCPELKPLLQPKKKMSQAKCLESLFNPTAHSITPKSSGVSLVELGTSQNGISGGFVISRGGSLLQTCPSSAPVGMPLGQQSFTAPTQTAVGVYPQACIAPDELTQERCKSRNAVISMRIRNLQYNNDNGYDLVEAPRGGQGGVCFRKHVFTKVEFRLTKSGKPQVSLGSNSNSKGANGRQRRKGTGKPKPGAAKKGLSTKAASGLGDLGGLVQPRQLTVHAYFMPQASTQQGANRSHAQRDGTCTASLAAVAPQKQARPQKRRARVQHDWMD